MSHRNAPLINQRKLALPVHLPDRALATLKAQILQPLLAEAASEDSARLIRLAAMEAEALVWQTPYPHLFFPVLLEEKLEAVRRYSACQEALREKSQAWSHPLMNYDPQSKTEARSARERSRIPRFHSARACAPWPECPRISYPWLRSVSAKPWPYDPCATEDG